MKRLAVGLFALGLLSPAVAFSDEKTEKTETHETDGKKTTRTRKVKHSADAKGNEEVKTETVRKTEVGKATGSGDEKATKSETHETDGKKTTQTKQVKHSADGDGNSAIKTETTKKTEVK
jgi:hypothetical protein